MKARNNKTLLTATRASLIKARRLSKNLGTRLGVNLPNNQK